MISCPRCRKQFPGRSLGSHGPKCNLTAPELFWNLVQKGEGCWPWMGAKHRDGYGRANVEIDGRKRIRIAHRMAWYFTHGKIPADKDVCHSCDNRICCNPAHLWLGVHVENMADCKAKGRHTWGTKNPRALLQPDDVLKLRALYWRKGKNSNIDELQRLYPHVSATALYSAATGRSWKHLGRRDISGGE